VLPIVYHNDGGSNIHETECIGRPAAKLHAFMNSKTDDGKPQDLARTMLREMCGASVTATVTKLTN
jgi:hypothetical protein